MNGDNSNTLISYSFDGEKGKKFSVFSKKIMQSSGIPSLYTGLVPFLPACEVTEYMNSDAEVINHRYKEFQTVPN